MMDDSLTVDDRSKTREQLIAEVESLRAELAVLKRKPEETEQSSPVKPDHPGDRLLQMLLCSSPTVIFTCEPEGNKRVKYISENVFDIWGYTPEQFFQDENFWSDRVHPDDLAPILANAPQVFQKAYHSHEYRFRRADGSYGWVLTQMSCLQDNRGNPLELIGYLIDISQRRQLEAELTQREQLLEDFFHATSRANIGFCILDRELRYIKINQTLADFNGFPIAAHYGKTVYEVVPELADQIQPLIQVLETGEPICSAEVSGYTPGQPDKVRHWLDYSFPIYNGNTITAIGCLILENSDRFEAEAALRLNELNLREAQRVAHVGSWRWDCQNQTTLWSEEVYHIHGLDPTQPPLTPAEIEQCVYPDDLEIFHQKVIEPNLRVESFEADFRIVRPNGEVRYVQARGEPVFDQQGELTHLVGTVMDVTDRKQVEAALLLNEFYLREAQRIAHVGHWLADIAASSVSWSEELFRIHGLAPSSTLSPTPNFDRYIHPDDLDLYMDKIVQPTMAGEAFQCDLRIVRPDGEVRYVEARGEAIVKNKQGEPLPQFGTVLDVTERKQVEARLEESNRRWLTMLNTVQMIVVELNSDGCVAYVNPFFLQLTAYSAAEVLGQPWFEKFVLPQDGKYLLDAFKRILNLNLSFPYHENPIVTRSGEERMIAWNNTLLRDAGGNPIGTISLGEDITDRHRLEQMKSEFVSMVSHELRTPLTSIQAALSLLDENLVDPTSEDGQATIHIAADGIDRLVRLVNDILDLDRLDSDRVQLNKAHFTTHDLLTTAFNQMLDLANQSQVSIVVKPGSCELYADRDRLLQVLTNLLNNAIRFSPKGNTIWLKSELKQWTVNDDPSLVVHHESLPKVSSEPTHQNPAEDKDDQQATSETEAKGQKTPPPPYLLFSITDQGRGIPSDKLESIFDRFQQVDASDSREKSGTGLGLAICRSIVEQHGGKIWAESILGQGSTFWFTIPLTEPHHDNETDLSD